MDTTCVQSCGSSVSIVTRKLAEQLWFDSQQKQEIFSCSNMSRSAPKTKQPPI